MTTLNLNKASKAKYIDTDGIKHLVITDTNQKTRNGTEIISLQCKDENDAIYRKEFSLSQEGIGYFIEFINDAKLLTEDQKEKFTHEMLLGKMFTTEFGKKKNSKYDPNNEKSKPYYVYELPNKITPYKE